MGVPLAYLVGKTNIPGKTVLRTLGALQTIDPSLEEASLVLGHDRTATTFRVTLPLVFPSILSGSLLVFMQAVENFGVPAIIGEGLPVLATRAYALFVNELGGNPSMASALSMVLLTTTSAVLVMQRLYLAKKSFSMKSTRTPDEIQLRPLPRAIATGVAFFLCLLPLLPFVVRSSSSLLYQISPTLEEASISLGYSPPATFWKITLRLMGSGIVSGAILAWVTTLAELSSSIVLYTARTSTIPVMIYQAVTSTDYGRASAFAVVLMFSTVVPLFLVNKTILRRGSLL